MNRLSKVLCSAAMLLSLAACSSSTTTETTTPSTTAATEGEVAVYDVTASGYGGEMNVKVSIQGDTITDIELGENHETNVVIDRAFPVIRERILEANSPVVDSVSAATYSSYAVKQAVADAMEQHGLTVEGEVVREFPSFEGVEPTVIDDITTDIVIVGGGPAGLGAAISAKQANADLDVTVVEKMDILSGNGKFDMNYFDLINSQAQEETGNTYTIDDFKEMKAKSGETPERIEAWANEEWTMDQWLRDMGVELNYNYSATNHMAEEDQYSGEVIQAGMEAEAQRLGVTIITGTKGEDFVMDGDAVVGVQVLDTHTNERYNIMAGQTIIATGGFCANKELVAEYLPGYEVLNTSNQMGATGDFVKVFEAHGMALQNMDRPSVFANIIVPRRDLTGGADLNLLVNKEGELLDNSASGLDRYNQMAEQTDGATFYITDSTGYDSFYRIRKHVGLGYYSEGATLEELGEALGIDGAALAENVAAYNEEQAALGEEGTRQIDAEGPYYGVRVEPALHMTKGGVSANENAQVLYEDGSVVPNLYAAGEVAWQSGGYSASVCFGRIAGTQAAAALSE